MKTWMIPELQELDVKLTAKIPGCVEQEGFTFDNGYVFCSTYDMAEGDPATNAYNPNEKGGLES